MLMLAMSAYNVCSYNNFPVINPIRIKLSAIFLKDTFNSAYMPTKTLNIKGEICPYTFVKSKLALEELESGDTLEVLVDHVPAVDNVSRSMQEEGHEILDIQKLNDVDYRIIIRKK